MIRHAPSIGLGLGLSLRGSSPLTAAGFSAEALNYFSRLDTAGDTTYTSYKQPLANYIDGLIAAGMWDGMESAASFVGVGIEGIAVPLKAGMPTITNNNFVDADLDQLTGLKGDGSTKYLGTNANTSLLSTDDHSLSVYLSGFRDSSAGRYISGFPTSNTVTLLGNPTGFRARSASGTLNTLGTSTSTTGIVGISRDNSANYDWRYGGAGNQIEASVSIDAANISVFADSIGAAPTAARLATYHAGAALDLAMLGILASHPHR